MSTTQQPTGYEVRDLSSSRTSDWRDVVDSASGATPFHTLSWLNAMEAAMGYPPASKIVYRSERPRAVVPGFHVPALGRSTITNPFCEYGFPLVESGIDHVEVLKAVKESLEDDHVLILKESQWTESRGYSSFGFGGERTGVSYRLPVDLDFDTLWRESFDATLRSDVETANDAGLTVTTSNEVPAFYDRYVGTMERLGSPQFSLYTFVALKAAFNDRFRLYLVMDGDEILGGLVALVHGETAYLWSNGSDRSRWAERPNHLLYVEAIQHLMENGCRIVDFGRTEPGSGVAHFKKTFGAHATPLISFVYPPRFTQRASVSGYKRLAPLSRLASPLITHPRVGPRLKRIIHE